MENFSLTGLFDYIFNLFDISYMVTVLISIEFIKLHVPRLGTIKKTLLTLLVAVFVAMVFVGINVILGTTEAVDVYAKRLLISFLGVTTFYSLLIKALIAAVKKATTEDKGTP